MAGKNTAVFGIYKGSASGGTRRRPHLSGGILPNNDISVLLPDAQSSKEFASQEKHQGTPSGTAAGVATGGIVGGTLGLLAGIGTLAIPGIGPFIAAGPIMASLAGLGVGGAVGGLIGALVGMGIPEYGVKRYEGRVKDGGVLLLVHCDTSDEISRAENLLLKETGAEDISSSGEKAVSSHGVSTETVGSKV